MIWYDEYIEDSNEKNDNNHLQNIVCHRELKAISNSFDIDVLKELTDVIGAWRQMMTTSSLVHRDN